MAVDLLVDGIERARADGLTVHFGDASRRAVLEEVGAACARVVVVTVGEPGGTRRIITHATRCAPRSR